MVRPPIDPDSSERESGSKEEGKAEQKKQIKASRRNWKP
jgi:hypothetical protein